MSSFFFQESGPSDDQSDVFQSLSPIQVGPRSNSRNRNSVTEFQVFKVLRHEAPSEVDTHASLASHPAFKISHFCLKLRERFYMYVPSRHVFKDSTLQNLKLSLVGLLSYFPLGVRLVRPGDRLLGHGARLARQQVKLNSNSPDSNDSFMNGLSTDSSA